VDDARSFGQRLRELRRGRGLSQAELAGTELSPSYVSLLEADRRKPSASLVDLLAKRLNVAPAELTGAASREREVASFVERFSLSRRAWRDGDYAGAETLLRDAAAEAEAIGDLATWWTATNELAELYRLQQKYDSAHELLVVLADNPTTANSAWLGADVRTALSETLRAMGRLQESVEAGALAVALARMLTGAASEYGRALLSLLAAQAECGDLASCRHTAIQLEQIVDNLSSPRLKSAAHWALGNEAFLRGLADEAVAHHERAFAFASPQLDPIFWARLHRASASMRLLAGKATDDVPELLGRARAVLELLGTRGDLQELAISDALASWRSGDPAGALQLADSALTEPSALPSQQRGTALQMRARALRELGRLTEAREAYQAAAKLFHQAGAYRRASNTWQELNELIGQFASASKPRDGDAPPATTRSASW
jgi:transcriptional regulator with XRE-family HTH domain